MTDAEIDAIIDQAKPELRKVIRNTLEHKNTAMWFPLGMIPFENKQTWSVVCFVMIEPLAELVYPLLATGVPKMIGSQMKPSMKPVEQQSAPVSGGIPIPGF